MPQNPLEKAIEAAVEANATLGRLFDLAGTANHPQGKILAAYRVARLALRNLMAQKNTSLVMGAREVMESLRESVRTQSEKILQQAQAAGIDLAVTQLDAYGVTTPGAVVPDSLVYQRGTAVDAIDAIVKQQEATVRAVLANGGGANMILGNGQDRLGIVKPGETVGTVAYWISGLFSNVFDWYVIHKSGKKGDAFSKQAIAALDDRTTDCCLRAHGQVKPLDEPFHLTGTPRYDDYMDWPPFHWWCRTSVTLYDPIFDDGLTGQMRQGADVILAERDAGKRIDRNPADAYGRNAVGG